MTSHLDSDSASSSSHSLRTIELRPAVERAKAFTLEQSTSEIGDPPRVMDVAVASVQFSKQIGDTTRIPMRIVELRPAESPDNNEQSSRSP